MSGPPETDWDYSNLPVRPSGPFLRAAEKVVPGIGATQDMVVPYAHAWEDHNRRVVRGGGPFWIVLGDSMAQGIGATHFDRGWPGQLAERMSDPPPMVNLSAYGARVCDVVERQWPAARALGPLALVTVVVGSNDLWRKRRAGLVPAFRQLIDALPPGAVVANIPNPVREAADVNELLATTGRAKGLRVVDMRHGNVSWRGKLAPDHFHPNDLGYAAMADTLARALPPAPG